MEGPASFPTQQRKSICGTPLGVLGGLCYTLLGLISWCTQHVEWPPLGLSSGSRSSLTGPGSVNFRIPVNNVAENFSSPRCARKKLGVSVRRNASRA